MFPKAQVKVTPDGDYRYRASVLKQDVAAAISARIHGIGYDNFKNSCPSARHDAYMGVWAEWHKAASGLDRKVGR